MSSIHTKLAAIAAAIHNAFDFADPLAKIKEAEDEFKLAVADEIKDLTDRVTKLEKAAAAAPALVDPVGNSPLFSDESGSPETLLGGEAATSAAVILDSAIVSASIIPDASASTAAASDTALDKAIADSAGPATE